MWYFSIFVSLQSNEENFKICVNFTNSHLKHHRFLSVNSHEVKRDVSGICEKFRFSNLHDTEKKFKKLVDDCLSDSLSVNHYEKDVGFAIIQLLTSLAYDPISHLKDKIRKGQNVVPFKTISIKAPSKASETVINSLLKDNFKLPSNETDSELSEWSDSDEDSVLGSKSEESSAEDQSQQSKVSFKSSLQPPQRQSTIKTIVLEESADWLCENIEHSWWKNEVSTLAKLSSHPAANFCTLWQKHLSEKSMGFIKPQPTSLLSEKCLLREIFWMFLNPVDCKFFKMDGNEISLQANVTLPSNMPSSLHNFLKSTVRSMNIMNRLRVECQRSYSLNRQITHTIEIYYGCVQSLVLDRVSEFILEQEAIVKAQEESYTILILNKLFKPYEKMLELMWKIHETSVLDDSKYPPHICSSYLLASLYRLVLSSCSREEKNLAITIFISCLKTFMDIFEVFCTEARLDDLRSEFLMENEDVGGFDIITPRPLAKSKEKSFYLNDDIASILAADPTVNIMLNYCLKASFSFDIISKLNRVQDMRKIMNNGESLFDEFLEMIQAEIVKFTKRKITEKSEDTASSQDSNVIQDKSGIKNKKLVDDIRSGLLMNGDYVLMLSLESSLKKLENDDKPPSNEMTPEKLFDNLQEVSSYLLLPLEHSVQNILKKLLDKKVLIAESFVKDIYLKEFSIEQHLRDVRKLYFLESSELINFLYLTLFPQMESDDSSWSNPFVLTVAFNEAIGPQSDALFSVEVDNVDNLSVLGAIGKLAISYNVHKNICNIFTPNAILKYNEGE